MRLVALYTTHLVKKHKTYHDGFVVYHPHQRRAVLQDDSGWELSSCLLKPGEEDPQPGKDGIAYFQGYLVNTEGIAGEESALAADRQAHSLQTRLCSSL